MSPNKTCLSQPLIFPRFGKIILSFLLTVCVCALPASAALKITQIMYDMYGTDDSSWEWIEIYNNGASTVNLAGYVLDDGNGTAHASANIASGSIPAGGFAYLHSSQITSTDFIRVWGQCNAIAASDWAANGLNNTGDKVAIWSSFAAYTGNHATHAGALDSVAYTNAAPWPVSNDSGTIYLTNLTADNHTGGNWALATSASYGTTVAGGRVLVDNKGLTEYAAIKGLPRLKIVQIMYDVNGSGNASTTWEWVEVYNDWPVAANLAGYVFSDKNSTLLGAANIAGGTILPGKTGYLFNGATVTASDFINKWGRTNAIPVSPWPSSGLSETSDTLGVWTSYTSYNGDQATHAKAIETVPYSGSSPWPVRSGLPRSIYLTDVDANNLTGANWALAFFDDRGKTVSLGRIVVEDQGGIEYGAMDFNPYGYKHIFGYRCFTGSQPAWVSPLTGAGSIVHSTAGDVVETARGTGFSTLAVTDFDGSTEFVQGSSALTTKDMIGDDSFTIQGWFKADSVSGTRTIFSNTESNNGYSLKIISGELQGEVRFNDNTGTLVNTTIGTEVVTPNVVAGNWYYAAFRVKRSATTYDLSLYLNGELVSSTSVGGVLPNGSVRQSTELPMIGSEPSGGAGSGGYFDGQIYGVRVSNYALSSVYIQLDRARDGSRYLNDVSYHDGLDVLVDYRFDRTADNLNYTAFWQHFTDGFYTPYLNDNYIPQGLTYDSSTNRMYLSMYWRDTDGTVGTYPSIMVEIDKSTNKTRRVFQLKTDTGAFSYAHAPALAYYDGNVYLPDGTSVYRYQLSSAPGSYVFNPSTLANSKGDQNPYPATSKYSGLNLQGNTSMQSADIKADYNGDIIFWTSMNDGSGYRKMLGFKINPTTKAVATTATHVYTLPILQLQGALCYSATSTQFKFYLVKSGGDNDSEIWDVVYNRGTATAVSSTLLTKAPAGLEDVVMIGSDLWTSSETAATAWQKYTLPGAWNSFFPFVFGLDIGAF